MDLFFVHVDLHNTWHKYVFLCQTEAGIQRLSSHFSWPEFCDVRCGFHQEFVYEVTKFAAGCGLPWSALIQAAGIAKRIFPQLDGESKHQHCA